MPGGLRDWLARLSLRAMALCLLGMVALDFWQVVQRYVLGTSWPWAGDVGIILMLTLAWIGAGHLWLVRGHIAVELVPRESRLAQALRGGFDVLVLVGGLVLLPMTWTTMAAYSVIELPTLPLPGSVKYAPVAAGLGFLALAAALMLVPARR